MIDFNPELWGLRIRHAAGLSNPPPTQDSTMTDKADEIARKISLIYVPFPGRKALKDAADLIRSYAAEIEAERDRLATECGRLMRERDAVLAERDRLAELATVTTRAHDRSEDRARQAEAELIAMREVLKVAYEAVDASLMMVEQANFIPSWDWLRVVRKQIAAALSSPTPEGGRVIRNVEDAKLNLQKVVADVVGGGPVDQEILRAAESAIERMGKPPTPEGGGG